MAKDLLAKDLYDILEIDAFADINDIKKAYRKKALKCHPDKNPDNPAAIQEFHELSEILKILSDEAARKAYDRVLKGRKEAAIRHSQLDSKRQKLKDDLLAREAQSANHKNAEQKLQEEIVRLRKEGSREVEEEIERVMTMFTKERCSQNVTEVRKFRLKLKWKAEKKDSTNGGYNADLLKKFFLKYGENTLVMSKKNGSALIELSSQRDAELAVTCEKGLQVNPLTISWVSSPPNNASTFTSSTIKESDFESLTLTKMRQAEERKRLIEQMLKEDED